MAEDHREVEVIDATQQPSKNALADLMKNDLVKELAIPYLKATLKKEMGIGTSEKELHKKAFGRFMYAMRDFIQGTWWVLVATVFSLGLVLIILKVLSKWAGV